MQDSDGDKSSSIQLDLIFETRDYQCIGASYGSGPDGSHVRFNRSLRLEGRITSAHEPSSHGTLIVIPASTIGAGEEGNSFLGFAEVKQNAMLLRLAFDDSSFSELAVFCAQEKLYGANIRLGPVHHGKATILECILGTTGYAELQRKDDEWHALE